MVCPVCGSDEAVILKNKIINSKSKEIREFLLKCDECESVYKERIAQENPKPYRLIISEHEEGVYDYRYRSCNGSCSCMLMQQREEGRRLLRGRKGVLRLYKVRRLRA